MPANFSAEDLFLLLQNLLPPGAAFPREDDTTQSALLKGLADTEVVTCGRMSNLLIDSFPATTVELLPEWEATLGLPDPCWGPEPTLQERQRSVLAKLLALGGQSIPYLISVCTLLGFPNMFFGEFTAYRCGMNLGQPMLGEQWNYALKVEGTAFTIHYFTLGHDTCGEPFAWWDNNPLICELKKLAPAHVYLTFQFGNIVTANIFETANAIAIPSATARFLAARTEHAFSFDASRYNTAWLVNGNETTTATATPTATGTFHKSITETGAATSKQDWSDVEIHQLTTATDTPTANATFRPSETENAAASATPTATATYHVASQPQNANATSAQDAIDTSAGTFIVDTNGNIILDANGNPILAPVQ